MHSRQPGGPQTITGSPGATPVVPDPSCSAQPAFSCPSVSGSRNATSPPGGYLQDVQIGVAGSRAPDLHQDLTRPGFGKRDLTKFARLLSEASEQVSTPLSMSTSSMCRHVCIHIIENGSPPRKTRATPSLCISMSPRDSMYCGSTLPWASSTSRPRPGSWVPPDQPPTPTCLQTGGVRGAYRWPTIATRVTRPHHHF